MIIDKVIDLVQDAIINGESLRLNPSQVAALGEFLRRSGL